MPHLTDGKMYPFLCSYFHFSEITGAEPMFWFLLVVFCVMLNGATSPSEGLWFRWYMIQPR